MRRGDRKTQLAAAARRREGQIPIQHRGTEARRKSGNWVRNAWEIFRAALGEIFDESSYHRYLERTCSARSRESYRTFMREREAISARKPRCC